MTKPTPVHVRRLYLDTNILIYLIEGHREFGQAAWQLIADAEAMGAEICTSDLAVCEALIQPYKSKNTDLIKDFEAFLDPDQSQLSLIEFLPSALEQVPELAASCGLKLVDAMHLSLALQAGCDGFATNDRGFESAETLIDIIPLT